MPSNSDSSSTTTTTTTEPYMFMGHETVPTNVTLAIVHKSVTAIPKKAFRNCRHLKAVVLPEGLVEIRANAFHDCRSLEKIISNTSTFPSTLRVIGECAFGGCSSLVNVDFNEGLQIIACGAFDECLSILLLKIPSTVTTIGNGAFYECSALKDVRLCSKGQLQTIESYAFYRCYSLLGINIPSSVTTIGRGAFCHCDFLRNVSITFDSTLEQVELEQSHLLDNLHQVGCSLDLVKGRFDGMSLKRESPTLLKNVHEHEHVMKENLTQVDCMGMTPLHIVACSGWHDVRVYKYFVSEYSEALLIQDKWGEIPLGYVILSEAPQEIIRFLFEKHSSNDSNQLPFDFQAMVKKLLKREGTSAEFVQSVIQAQRSNFSNLDVDWQRLVEENVEGDMHVKMFAVLVEANVSNFNSMSSGHQLAINNLIKEAGERYLDRKREGRDQVRDLIVASVRQFTEATAMIELALWQVAIDELKHGQESHKEGNHCQIRAKILNTEVRNQCRFKYNAEVIISCIIPFF